MAPPAPSKTLLNLNFIEKGGKEKRRKEGGNVDDKSDNEEEEESLIVTTEMKMDFVEKVKKLSNLGLT